MCSRRCRVSLLIAAFMLTASSPEALPQQTAPARGLFISGVVRDDDTHDALSAVALELQRISGDTASPPVVSGTRGEFQFNGVVSGDYRITAHQKGYETATLDIMLGGIPLSNVSITLRRSAVAPGSVPGDAISAHQLSIPEKARDDFDKGFKLLNGTKPDYRRALTYFERAIKEYPDYYEASMQIGIAYSRLGDNSSAEQILHKTLAMNPNYADAYGALALVLCDEKKFAEAEPPARKAVELDQSSWQANYELGRALYGLDRSGEAEPVVQAALKLKLDDGPMHLLLANIHVKLRNYPALLDDLNAYLKIEPTGADADHARDLREKVQQAIANSQTAPAQPPNK